MDQSIDSGVVITGAKPFNAVSMNTQFYSALASFSHFEDFTDNSHYQALPEDWFVFIADIKGSTKAIERGLYKEVNLIGAASITLCIQALGDIEFPFVFGGDGASLCIPDSCEKEVSEILAKLVTLAKTNFNLDLRVAKIPAKLIYEAGKQLLVAKLEITPGRSISVFRGGGLAYADALAKSKTAEFQIQPTTESVEHLAGLSCRWSPIPSTKGVILSLLVLAKEEGAVQAYAEVLDIIRRTLDCTIEETNPVSLGHVKYKSFFKGCKEESKYHKSLFSLSFLRRVVDIALSVLIFKYHIPFFFFDEKKYSDSIPSHSDFRKFDDALRLVMDCSEEQYLELKTALGKAYQAGLIYYGLHVSDNVLMTCFLESAQQGEHLHFVDGGNGGLAMASVQLKSQLKRAA